MSVSSVLQSSATFGNQQHTLPSSQQYLMARPAYRFKPSVTVTVGQDGTDGLYGRRLRKNLSQVRRTADHASTVLNFLQARVWQKNSSAKPIIQPDVLYSSEILPPAYEKEKPIDCVTTKFLRAAMNKVKCPIYSICWTPEGRRLITGASSGEFTLWNGIAFNFETILQAHDVAVRSMVWSHNDQWMVTADHDGFIKYWQANMNNVKMFQAHKEAIRSISFCPTDSKFATASDDGTVRVWDFIRCHEERILRGHGSDVRSVHWHPQKGLIVSGSRDSQQPVKLWDPKSGQCLSTLHDHKNGVMDVKWNDNGNWLISGSRDHLIKLYDIRMMKEMQTLRGHKKEVTALSWHPINEGLFVSGGGDGSMMFWFVGNEKEVGEIEGAHEQAIWTLAWHPLGHICASGSNDNNTKFWTRNKPGDPLEDFYGMGSGQYDQPTGDSHPVSQKSVASVNHEDQVETPTAIHIPGMGLEGDLLDRIKGVGNSSERERTGTYNNPVRQAAFAKKTQRQFERVWTVNKFQDGKGPGGDMDMRRPQGDGGDPKRNDPFPQPFFSGPPVNRPGFNNSFMGGPPAFNPLVLRAPFNGPLNPMAPSNQRQNLGFAANDNFIHPPAGFLPSGFHHPPAGFTLASQHFSPPMRSDFSHGRGTDSSQLRLPGNVGPGRMPGEEMNVASNLQTNWGMTDINLSGSSIDPRMGQRSGDADFRRGDLQHSDPRLAAHQPDVDLRMQTGPFPNIVGGDYRSAAGLPESARDPRMRPRPDQTEFGSDWHGWSGSEVAPWPVASDGRPADSWSTGGGRAKHDSWEPWNEDQRRMREGGDKWNDEYSQDVNGTGGGLNDSPSAAHLNPKRKWQQEYEAQQGVGPEDSRFSVDEEEDFSHSNRIARR